MRSLAPPPPSSASDSTSNPLEESVMKDGICPDCGQELGSNPNCPRCRAYKEKLDERWEKLQREAKEVDKKKAEDTLRRYFAWSPCLER